MHAKAVFERVNRVKCPARALLLHNHLHKALTVARAKILGVQLSVPLFPILSCFSPLNLDVRAFSIWIVSPVDMARICSFHRHSLIVPVSSAIKALVMLA